MSLFSFFKKKKEKENPLSELIAQTRDMFGDGLDVDMLPNGTGEFGWEITNPIPMFSVPESYMYLEGLRFEDNMKVIYNRIGNFSSDVTPHPLDGYQITHPDGSNRGILYISPYQKRNSNLKPKGLK